MMLATRRSFSISLATAALPGAGWASGYPSRPIKMIVGFAPGGSTDAVARFYAQKMSEVLKASIVVDNKPGAGQMLAIRSVLAAPADGYTVYMGTASALSQLPGIRKDLAYDPLKDFSMIGLAATVAGVLVASPTLNVRNLQELSKLPQAKNGAMNYASSGIGSASHLQTEYLLSLTGMKMTHIPFKADADIMRELAVGSVQFGIAPVQGAMASIQAGRVRALAVTGTQRLSVLPDVPTLGESGFKGMEGVDPYTYYGILGPTGLPAPVVSALNGAINQVSRSPEAIKILRDRLYSEPQAGAPERLRKFIEADIAKWSAFGKAVKLTE